MSIRIFYILFFSLFLSSALFAQSIPSYDYDDLLNQLEISASKGEKRSLRDLGSLLDKSSTKKKALEIIKKFSLFSDSEINLNKSVSKSKFHSFYYDFEKKIQFSDIIGIYYITPLEERKIKFEVKVINIENDTGITPLKAIKRRMGEAIADKNQGIVIQQIEMLGELHYSEASNYLLEISEELRNSSKKWSKELHRSLCKSLAQSRDIDCLKEMLNLISEKKIDAEFAAPQLVMLTNIEMDKSKEISSKNLIKTYRNYIDSLGTIEDMRSYGYTKLFNFQPSFFNHIVDYYGRILCFADNREWIIHNAVQDLIATQHPRALFYLAAMGYKNTFVNKGANRTMDEMVQTISRLTNLKIGVENVKRSIDFDLGKDSDKSSLENYLTYWAAQYSDYEWDEGHNSYVNKYNALEKTQNYEKLFRRLNSRNDSVAMASFAQLTEGEPSEIIALAEKYRQMFRSYNQSLPPFKYKYLEQLSTLTQYCKKHNINYKPGKSLSKLLSKLYSEKDELIRYKLENEIIQSLKLNDVTALEYWGCINQANEVTNFSLGRILDVFYSKNWAQVLESDAEIRLYLKKSLLLANIGVIGVCNNYLNKFDIKDPKVNEKLNEIKSVEVDRQILNQITLFVSNSNEDGYSVLSDFIQAPTRFNKRDIRILPEPNSKEFTQIVESIKTLNDNNAIKNLFYYLRLHPSIKNVPQLFELAKDKRILHKKRGMELTIGDNVTPILENIFNYNFPVERKEKPLDISPWNKLWETDNGNYGNWGDKFFETKTKQLVLLTELSIDDINLITESPNYSSKYKLDCLIALKKVKPVKDIRTLNISPKLSIKDDLKHFESFEFSHKVLDDIPKLFEIDDPSSILNYVFRKAEKYKPEEKGSLFNNLFRYPWFTAYINSGTAKKKEILFLEQCLVQYLNESDYLSEFEEQATTLHITQLQNIGKPLDERILSAIQLNIDKNSKAKIQETIISTTSYQEIGVVAKYFNELYETLGDEPWAFLRKDFGLPIFDLGSQEKYETLLNHHKEKSEYDFYMYYLEAFGVDFMSRKNELDYQKIYEILQFDAVSPFVAGSGGKRDYYTYGIIKILELKFNTTLGFHQKLNENQSFYSFSTAKRSKAWINYLIEKKLIKPDIALAPSFNQVIE